MSVLLVFVQFRGGLFREVACACRYIRALILITDVGLPYHESSVKRLPWLLAWLQRVTNARGVTVLEVHVMPTARIQSREPHSERHGYVGYTCR